MFQNSLEMQQIFQKCGQRQRRKAIPKTASEALLAVKNLRQLQLIWKTFFQDFS
jgi:hypothetical protein